ncbi:MAG: TetR/AcrR family transcriptional regulator [Myxococcota bacterium]
MPRRRRHRSVPRARRGPRPIVRGSPAGRARRRPGRGRRIHCRRGGELDTAARILAEAEGLVAERGVDALSIREVARRVGITPMAVYRHYDGLDALRAGLRDRASTGMMAQLVAALGEPDVRSRFEAAARGYVRWAMAEPALFRLLFTGGPPPDEAARLDHVRRDATAFRFLVDRMREAVDAGLLPTEDPEALAIDWWALVHGLVVLQQEGKLRLPPEAFEAHVEGAVRRLFSR